MNLLLNSSWRLLVLPAAFCLLSGCGLGSADKYVSPHADDQPVLPPVYISKTGVENGHPAGIRLAIQWKKDTDSTTIYTLMSSYEDKPIGLTLILPRENITKPASWAYLKTVGPPSDIFLDVLAMQFKQLLNPNARFVDSVRCSCINLDTALWVRQRRKRRLYRGRHINSFDAERDTDDAELFMNINKDKQYIEFAEKDQEYREHLINFLNGSKRLNHSNTNTTFKVCRCLPRPPYSVLRFSTGLIRAARQACTPIVT